MICLPVEVTCEEDARRALKQGEELCDLVELRLDFCAEPETWLFDLLGEKNIPVIVTDRCPEEGGQSPRTVDERLDLLRRAAEAGAEYIDCELRFMDQLPAISLDTSVIGSYHDFKTFPADIREIFKKIADSRADIVKVAVQAGDICDNFRLFEAMQAIEKPVIGICMGEKGEISRILGKKYGNILTFGTAGEGTGTASGQVSIADLKNLYDYKEITADTQVYGVAGNPIEHSASPEIHNAALHTLGIPGVYVRFLVDDMQAFMRDYRAFGFAGLSVTLPHKVALMDCVDEVDDIAVQAQAANTAYTKDGKLRGTNTDIKAACGRLAELAGGLKGRKIAVLGAGGAARGICFGLKEEGADILIVNRTLEKAEELAELVGCDWCGYPEFSGDGMDIIVNTTSVGMHPDVDAAPVGEEVLDGKMIVFDAIYNPPETKLIGMAREKGCRTLTGVDMFIAQAEEQFRFWFDRPAPEGIMRDTFRDRFGTDG